MNQSWLDKQEDIYTDPGDELEPKHGYEQLREIRADLLIQSMLFDMDVDWETLSLMPKSEHKDAVWITRWKEKQANSDWTVIDNGY